MKRVVVQIVQHLMPGGIETLVLEMQRCAEPGDEVHIISLEGEQSYSTAMWPLLSERSHCLHFIDKPPGVSFRSLWALFRLLWRLRPAIVHTHHIGPLIYGGLAARLAGVSKVIHTEHDAWHLGNEHRLKVERWALTLVRPLLVADACLVASSLKSHLPKASPVVIHNGVDVERFSRGSKQEARKQFNLPGDMKIVGCAARLAEVKGHEVLLDAVFRLPANVHLALAGTGPLMDDLKRQAKDLGMEHRVHFLGRVDDMPQFYRAIDVFCLASLNEGMPLSPLEAQACGAPVVLTDVGGCREAICPETGMLVEAQNPRVLAIALKRQLARRLDVNPREFVLRGKAVHDMVRAYNKLVAPASV